MLIVLLIKTHFIFCFYTEVNFFDREHSVLCRFQVKKFVVLWRNAKVHFYFVNKLLITTTVYLVAIF